MMRGSANRPSLTRTVWVAATRRCPRGLQEQAGLKRAREDGERWRSEARDILDGLAKAIDDQFRAWTLTEAESEVALLLLKGLSLKEVAGLRNVSERTVRQQAQAVYRKAGLSGRADLSAFFLEDLMLPTEQLRS
jgi:DNA-binding NarL/FixJ family response regulator